MVVTYRFRLLPSRRQHRALEALLESQRQLYNAALEERIQAFQKRGLTRSYMDQTKALTEWRRSDPDACAYPLCLQRATLKRLDLAYSGFFRRVESGGKPGYPRFRGKGWFDSFGFSEFEGITLRKNRLDFKGIPGGLKVHFHRQVPDGALIRSCSFRRCAKGWTVSFAVRVPNGERRLGSRAVGIDLGISTLAALSDGGQVPSLRAARKAERRVTKAQRELARKKPGSAGRRKARSVLARCHEAVARQRAEHLHQASARITREYDLIVVEKLNVRGLANSALAKDVHDASWAKFVSMLRYKAEKAGARLVEVDPRNTARSVPAAGR